VKPSAAKPEPDEGDGEEDAPTYSFAASDGPDPIVIPKADVLWEEVDGKGPTEFLWEMRKLNETYQMFGFLDRAQITDEVQRRIVRLPVEERRKLLRGWFDELNRPPSEGELPPES
jgi:hypothetical protein